MAADPPVLVVDGIDGGYALSAFAEPGPGEWVELPYDPDQPDEWGSVVALPHLVFVQTLGGSDLDESVSLRLIARREPPSAAEFAAMERDFAAVCRFELEAGGPILVWSVDLELQGEVFDKVGHFQCCLRMRIEAEPLDPDDPHESHVLEIWPTS